MIICRSYIFEFSVSKNMKKEKGYNKEGGRREGSGTGEGSGTVISNTNCQRIQN
jgi:hypothetical protein